MNNIRKIIKEKRIPQTEICQALEINESVLSLIINNKRKPSQSRLKALARYLKVSIKDLYQEVTTSRITIYHI